MKKIELRIIVIGLLFVASCGSIKELPNNEYTYKSKNRTLELHFTDDKTCILKNTFECSDIDPNFKNITIECNYTRKGDTIFLNRKGSNYDTSLYIDIPPQESNECSYLSKKSRERNSKVSPTYATDYEKYGLVPNVVQDTLYIVKNKIVYFKKNKNQSIGFVFKK